MKEIRFQGGVGVTHMVHVVIVSLLNKCVALYGEEQYKFLLNLELCLLSNHLDLRLALKEQAEQSEKHRQT